MTLKTRNQTIIIINIFQAICALCVFTLLISSIINNDFERIFGYEFFSLNGFPLLQKSDKSILVGILFLQIFIILTSFHLFYNFEKTQAPIIILFSIFLLGIQFEIFKIFIALFNLKGIYSEFHLWLGNVSFVGKLITIFSLFLIALNSKEAQKLTIEIDIIILITLCMFITISVPLNTVGIKDVFGIKPGFSPVLVGLYTVIFILTIATFIINYFETENKNILKLMIFSIIIVTGKCLIMESNILLLIILGIILFSVGMIQTFKTMHKMYSWD